MFPRTHRSIKSTKIPITYPVKSTNKIGATVTMVTSIVDGCSSVSFEAMYCLKSLSWIPLSRICAKLWRNLYYIKSLIEFYMKSFLTKILQSRLYKIERKNNIYLYLANSGLLYKKHQKWNVRTWTWPLTYIHCKGILQCKVTAFRFFCIFFREIRNLFCTLKQTNDCIFLNRFHKYPCYRHCVCEFLYNVIP